MIRAMADLPSKAMGGGQLYMKRCSTTFSHSNEQLQELHFGQDLD